MMNTKKKIFCKVEDWGLLPYSAAYQRQKDSVIEVIQSGTHRLILCEHLPVLTLGRMSHQENILFPSDELRGRGVQVIPVDRGGDVTLHSPGQLVIYPILNLNDFNRDLRLYLEKLEYIAIDLLREFAILATSISGKRGVWVGRKKIASIGVGVKKWITFHGMAINVNTDLNLFSLIRPCGLDVQMTSMGQLKAAAIDIEDVKSRLITHFCRHLDMTIIGDHS